MLRTGKGGGGAGISLTEGSFRYILRKRFHTDKRCGLLSLARYTAIHQKAANVPPFPGEGGLGTVFSSFDSTPAQSRQCWSRLSCVCVQQAHRRIR